MFTKGLLTFVVCMSDKECLISQDSLVLFLGSAGFERLHETGRGGHVHPVPQGQGRRRVSALVNLEKYKTRFHVL